MRFPEKLPSINQARYDLPVVGPIFAILEGLVEIPVFSSMGIITSWMYLVEYYYPASIVVLRHFELAGVSFTKIYQKGILGAYSQLQHSCFETSNDQLYQDPSTVMDYSGDEVEIAGGL